MTTRKRYLHVVVSFDNATRVTIKQLRNDAQGRREADALASQVYLAPHVTRVTVEPLDYLAR